MKHKEQLRELLEHELDDYEHYTYEFLDDEFCDGGEFEHYHIKIKGSKDTLQYLEIKVKSGPCGGPEFFIEMYEETWEEICQYMPSIKYFWMSVLKLHG